MSPSREREREKKRGKLASIRGTFPSQNQVAANREEKKRTETVQTYTNGVAQTFVATQGKNQSGPPNDVFYPTTRASLFPSVLHSSHMEKFSMAPNGRDAVQKTEVTSLDRFDGPLGRVPDRLSFTHKDRDDDRGKPSIRIRPRIVSYIPPCVQQSRATFRVPADARSSLVPQYL